jgi:biotin carboxylase
MASTAGPELVAVVHDTGHSWVEQVAQAIRAAGRQIGLVTGTSAGMELRRLESMVDRLVRVDDPTDPRLVASAAWRLADGARLGAVLSGNDGCVAAAAAAAEQLGVGSAPARAVALARNKYAARRALQRAGLPGPRHALLHSDTDAAGVADQVGLPAIVKPVNGTGSHLVLEVTSVAELAAAYRTLARGVPAADVGRLYATPLAGLAGAAVDPVDPSRSFLVEGKLRGREFCVDLIVRGGEIEQLALVDKALVDDRFFERGFVTPPFDLPVDRDARIRAAVTAAVRAIGLENSVAHVEVIDDQTIGPAVVEINAGRPGGPSPHTLYRLTAGVDMVAELVAVSLGERAPRTQPMLPTQLATLTVFAERSGRLRSVHGLDEVANHPDVLQVVPIRGPGDLISDEREMHVLLVVAAGFFDRDDLVGTYEQVQKLVKLEFDEPSAPDGPTGHEETHAGGSRSPTGRPERRDA